MKKPTPERCLAEPWCAWFAVPRGCCGGGAAGPACRAARLHSRVSLAAAGAAAPRPEGTNPLQLAERCCFGGGAVGVMQADRSQMGFAGCSHMHQEFSQRQNAYFIKRHPSYDFPPCQWVCIQNVAPKKVHRKMSF